MSETGSFQARDGARIFTRSWPAPNGGKADVILVHGFGEHSGRYEHVGAYLNTLGLNVYGYDHRYHGQSDGERGYIKRFDQIVDDLSAFVEHLQPRLLRPNPFYLGHSMGGLTLVRYASEVQPETAGLVFSGTLLAIPDSVSPILVALAPTLSKLLPRLPAANLETAAISRDPRVIEAYEKDPLVHHGSIKALAGTQINMSVQQARTKCHRITAPAYILHGDADRLAPVEGSQYLHDHISSQDKTLCIYAGGYHEQFNDLEKEKVLGAVGAWLSKQMPD